MIAVFLAQCKQLVRNPFAVLLMCVLTMVFTFALGSNTQDKLVLYAFTDDSLEEAGIEEWLDALNRSDAYEFKLIDEFSARQAVAEGRVELAVKLLQDDYRIVVIADNPNVNLAENHIRTVYSETLKLKAAEQQAVDQEQFRVNLEQSLAHPVLSVSTQTIQNERAGDRTDDSFKYDAKLQALFGFTLFFSIYTISFSVMNVLTEKRDGIWDRMILSPIRKTEMYMGHLLYSFMIGFSQMLLMFVVFKYVFDFELGEHFGALLVILAFYTFSIVALCLLLSGLVKTPQQFNAVIPVVSVSFAMLGGAYWPIEIVSNPFLLTLSKVVPVYYGMEGLKGAALYHYSLSQLTEPIVFLTLIGVVCLGIGINLMERRHI